MNDPLACVGDPGGERSHDNRLSRPALYPLSYGVDVAGKQLGRA
jgi:hypothetical protein